MTSTAAEGIMEQYCTFTVDGTVFGINVNQVQEVIRCQPMTRVPLANPVVTGLINLRGQIVTAIDLRRRLGLPERPSDVRPVNVVIQGEDGPVSLLVDDIDEVVEIAADRIEAPPHNLKNGRAFISGVHQMEDRLLLILATERAVDIVTPPDGFAAA